MRPTTLRHRIGRRGAALLVFAEVDFVYAYGLAFPDATTRAGQSFRFYADIMPLRVWALLWAVTGVVVAANAFRRSDRVGFAAAMAIKVLWGLTNVAAWLFGDVDRGYVLGAVFLTFAGFVWIISGWSESGDGRGPSWTGPSS